MNEDINRAGAFSRWLSRHTRFFSFAREWFDGPSSGVEAWARTTAGLVVFLLIIQLLTGLLLAFYFVPSIDVAHTTVVYVEKSVAGGRWVRALHYHGSQWLPVAIVLHLVQLFLRRGYERRPLAWLAWILLLALVMANGATGYSLPWDARAFFSTRIAAGIAGGLPLVGERSRAWLLGGADISALTLSRLYALHVLLVPALLLATVAVRLLVLRERSVDSGEPESQVEELPVAFRSGMASQFARNAVTVLTAFIFLSIISLKYPAPLGPEASQAAAGYLPRPGPQFLWLFQLLKYFSTTAASLVALLLPAFLLAAFALLPFLPSARKVLRTKRRLFVVGAAAFGLLVFLVGGLSLLAYLDDARDPRVREQLARQALEEDEFRRAPFTPKLTGTDTERAQQQRGQSSEIKVNDDSAREAAPPPQAYTSNCAKCHGTSGEGKSINPPLVGVASRPNRTAADIVAILNNPRAYNLEKRMPSFADKLSEDEKRAVAEWVVSLGR